MIDHPTGKAEIYALNDIALAARSLRSHGFAILERVYADSTIESLLDLIPQDESDRPTFRRTAGLFAIRQFLNEIPGAASLLLNAALHRIIEQLSGAGYMVVKSIYFDKPQASNWFVSYHQDLSISVNRKGGFPGFGPWTVKQGQFGVQPPLPILEDNLTIRIHLDNTDCENGALRVIPGSHCRGIYRPETIDWKQESEMFCEVPKGGIMIMRPLLLHASNRSTNNQPRRVVHIEFSRSALPEGLNWAESLNDGCVTDWLNRQDNQALRNRAC